MTVLVDIVLPEAQEQSTEAVVERWLRQLGEQVRLHEPLLEINTDKAVVEVPAPASGVLREILKASNEPITPGEVVGRIEVLAESTATAQPKRSAVPKGKAGIASPAEQRLSPAVRE